VQVAGSLYKHRLLHGKMKIKNKIKKTQKPVIVKMSSCDATSVTFS